VCPFSHCSSSYLSFLRDIVLPTCFSRPQRRTRLTFQFIEPLSFPKAFHCSTPQTVCLMCSLSSNYFLCRYLSCMTPCSLRFTRKIFCLLPLQSRLSYVLRQLDFPMMLYKKPSRLTSPSPPRCPIGIDQDPQPGLQLSPINYLLLSMFSHWPGREPRVLPFLLWSTEPFGSKPPPYHFLIFCRIFKEGFFLLPPSPGNCIPDYISPPPGLPIKPFFFLTMPRGLSVLFKVNTALGTIPIFPFTLNDSFYVPRLSILHFFSPPLSYPSAILPHRLVT